MKYEDEFQGEGSESIRIPLVPLKGRGALTNPKNRFEKQERLTYYEDIFDPDPQRPRTDFYVDNTKSILTKNNSPDLGFEYSVNPYRGCEHGCAYCYARPTHEYLGFSAGVDFETKIFVKENAPELLREALSAKKWKPQLIVMSGVTDCYQPIERKLRVTRRCLEVLSDFRNPVGIITKNALVVRDKDVLSELAFWNAVNVTISLTTLDEDLCGKLEPRTSRPQARLKAITELAKEGIPVGINMAPIIPGLTDREIPQVLKAAKDAGATYAGFTMVRLPYSVAEQFSNWLLAHFPDRALHVLSLIQGMRGGKLNVSDFGSRMKGEGAFAGQLSQLFKLYARKVGLSREWPELSSRSFRRMGQQPELF